MFKLSVFVNDAVPATDKLPVIVTFPAVKVVNVPTDVNEDPVTLAFKVPPVNVSAAAVTVISADH